MCQMTVDGVISALLQVDDQTFAHIRTAIAPRLAAASAEGIAPGISLVRAMEGLAGNADKPLRTPLMILPDGRLTRWEVAPGLSINPHTHGGHHLWAVFSGAGEMLGAGGVVGQVGPGSVVFSPSGEAHGVRNTGDGPLVFISVTLGEEMAPPVPGRGHAHEHTHADGSTHSHEHHHIDQPRGHDHNHAHGEGHTHS